MISIFLFSASLAAAVTAGCGADPISPSQVTGLRILGLRPEPAQPRPGDQVALELLWTDPPRACDDATPCRVGEDCVDGVCVRPDPTVQTMWFVVRLSAWQSSESSLEGGGISGLLSSQVEIPGFGACAFDQEACSVTCEGFGELTLWELCSFGCVGTGFEGVALCCGDAGTRRFEFAVPPDIEIPEPGCGQDASVDMSQVLQVQAQVCVGGRIDLCNPDVGSLSFPCVGEGAEGVTAISRVRLARATDEANAGPTIETPVWGRLESPDIAPWGGDAPLEVAGCLDDACAQRACSTQADCATFDAASTLRRGATSCLDGLCREEFSVGLSPEGQETYSRTCDAVASCASDADCATPLVCDCGPSGACDAAGGTCRRIENPVVAFFANGGAFVPGRAVLDTDGDGRPDVSRFKTRWLPPVLDECVVDRDCAPGTCDLDAGRCARDVSFWVVARDGRGGQDWIERTVRVVPSP
jgi:hypothetical protein